MDEIARYLPVFIAVCDCGGFSAAARRLGRTQPAVSFQIRQLETMLGTQLFERGRKTLLTTAGVQLRDASTAALSDVADAVRAIHEGAPQRNAVLRIASVSAFGRYVLFEILRERAFDRVALELRYPTAEEVFRMVDGGQVDAGFVYLPRASQRMSVRPVTIEELVLIAPKRLARKLAAIRSRHELEEHSFVTYDESDYVFGKWFRDVWGGNPRRINSAQHFEEIEETIVAVSEGRGLSIVPLPAAVGMKRAAPIHIHRFRARRCTNDIFIVTRAGHTAHPALRMLEDLVQRSGEPKRGGHRA